MKMDGTHSDTNPIRWLSQRCTVLVLIAWVALAGPIAANSGTAATVSGASTANGAPSERERAIQLLEHIQALAYAELGIAHAPPSRDLIEAFTRTFLDSPSASRLSQEQKEALEAELRKAYREVAPPSRYEDPGMYLLIESLSRKIQSVVDANSIELHRELVFGTLPTRQVNARVFPVYGTNSVIVAFERQLFTFALLFSKAVAGALPATTAESGMSFSTQHDDIAKRVAENPEILQRFREVLAAYLFAGSPGAAPQYFQGEPHSSLAAIIRESMELFVLGHEYGHIVAGHITDGREIKSAIGDEEVVEILNSWSDETEADVIGMQLSIAAMMAERFDVSLSYVGADFFFTSLDIVERALRVLRTGTEEIPDSEAIKTGSHPPAALRREGLRQMLLRVVEGDAGSNAVEMSQTIQYATELLWEQTKPAFVSSYHSGIRPHTSWGE